MSLQLEEQLFLKKKKQTINSTQELLRLKMKEAMNKLLKQLESWLKMCEIQSRKDNNEDKQSTEKCQ